MNVNKQDFKKAGTRPDDIKPDREVLREPGQISFKDAMKKVVNQKPKKKGK